MTSKGQAQPFVTVAVRVRPFFPMEIQDTDAVCSVRMDRNKTVVIDTTDGCQTEKEFECDHAFWSHDGFDVLTNPEPDLELPSGYFAPANRCGGASTTKGAETPDDLPFGGGRAANFDNEYASQRVVYEGFGREVLINALNGVDCHLLLVGQTGSGKGYSLYGKSLRGYEEYEGVNCGIVRQLCDELFKRKAEMEASGSTKVEVSLSMLEIDNEKINDVLGHAQNLKSKWIGGTDPTSYLRIEGLQTKVVDSFDQINRQIDKGLACFSADWGKERLQITRLPLKHLVMTISIKQLIQEGGGTREVCSDMNLVSLARFFMYAQNAQMPKQLMENERIVKSYRALDNVIAAWATRAAHPTKRVFVPYRDSKLTQVLMKEHSTATKSGAKKIFILATISPGARHLEATVHTLRFATRVKEHVTRVMKPAERNVVQEEARSTKWATARTHAHAASSLCIIS